MLQVRQRELQRGEGDRVILSGKSLGQPKRRYSRKSGTRASTLIIEFIGESEGSG
jgi:hypothetical protein